MGQFAGSVAMLGRMALVVRDGALARDLVRQDRDINRLNREIFNMALGVGDDPDTREWAMHMVLVAGATCRGAERQGAHQRERGEATYRSHLASVLRFIHLVRCRRRASRATRPALLRVCDRLVKAL
jgi:hypothetical protein